MKRKLTADEVDCFRELATVGFGHAATALSQLVNMKVGISVPAVKSETIEKLHGVMADIAPVALAVRLKVLGDLKGDIAVFYPRDSVVELLNAMCGRESVTISSKEVQSMVEETSSILAGAYLTAISEMTGKLQSMSVPRLLIDMPAAIVDEILIDLSREDEYAVMCETLLEVKERQIKLFFVFLNTMDSLKVILKAMKAGQ